MKRVAKLVLNALAALAASPFSVYALVGQRLFGTTGPYSGAAYALALVPGLPGRLLRRAFYCCVLPEAHWDLDMHFGSAVTQSDARLGPRVWIGAYCLIGRVVMEGDALVASRVSILSGRRPHAFRDPSRLIAEQGGEKAVVRVGRDVWIGEGAIVMADLGSGAVVGAGSVVVKPVEPQSVVGGNPARCIGRRGESATGS